MNRALEGYTPPYSSEGNDSERTIVYSSMNKYDWKKQADLVMENCSDLVDDASYLPYFYKRLYALGPTEFIAAADEARKRGFKKGRTFVNLIKEKK